MYESEAINLPGEERAMITIQELTFDAASVKLILTFFHRF